MKNFSIQYLRVISMLMIVLCHIVQQSTNPYIQITSQFFSVGVFIFFAISGFLYGGKKLDNGENTYKSWYINRWQKVLWPFYIFLIFLLLIYIILQKPIELKNWLFQFLNLQGLEIYVNGAEHLWFLTILAVCYLITPLLNEWKKQKIRFSYIILLVLWIMVCVSTYFINTQLGIYLIYLIVYILGYILGYKKPQIFSNKKRILLCAAVVFAVCVRLLTRFLWDGTPLYNVLCVGITQSVISISMLLLFLSFKFREVKLINFFDSISYEIYLVHYMFIVGPLHIIGITGNLALDSLAVIGVSIVSAFLLMKASKFIIRKFTFNSPK